MSNSLLLNFDGGNANGDAVWSVVGKCLTTKRKLCELAGRCPIDLPQTNNVAEAFAAYQALLFAYSYKDWYKYIQIVGDSQLVVRQITGEYACKSENLQLIIGNARKIYESLNSLHYLNRFTFGWVGRELNSDADELGHKFRGA